MEIDLVFIHLLDQYFGILVVAVQERLHYVAPGGLQLVKLGSPQFDNIGISESEVDSRF